MKFRNGRKPRASPDHNLYLALSHFPAIAPIPHD
jgi:hypothetical protein